MNNLRSFSFFTLILLGSMAVAQSGDWQELQTIPAGTNVMVTLKNNKTLGHCTIDEVTDDSLSCYFKGVGDRQFSREQIRGVYLAHRSKLIGFVLGAGYGALLGGTSDSPAVDFGRGANAVVAALLVGAIGSAVSGSLGPFVHGKAVYRSADSHIKKSNRSHALQGNPPKGGTAKSSQ